MNHWFILIVKLLWDNIGEVWKIMEIKLSKKGIGSNVKSIREGNDLSKMEFASLVNVDVNDIEKIEKGEKLPTLMQAINICNQFNIKIDAFLMIDKVDYCNKKKEML